MVLMYGGEISETTIVVELATGLKAKCDDADFFFLNIRKKEIIFRTEPIQIWPFTGHTLSLWPLWLGRGLGIWIQSRTYPKFGLK